MPLIIPVNTYRHQYNQASSKYLPPPRGTKPGYIVSCISLVQVLQCHHRQPPLISYPYSICLEKTMIVCAHRGTYVGIWSRTPTGSLQSVTDVLVHDRKLWHYLASWSYNTCNTTHVVIVVVEPPSACVGFIGSTHGSRSHDVTLYVSNGGHQTRHDRIYCE
jgi:hypothetical protein